MHSVACLESAALMLAAAYVGLLLLLRGACKTESPLSALEVANPGFLSPLRGALRAGISPFPSDTSCLGSSLPPRCVTCLGSLLLVSGAIRPEELLFSVGATEPGFLPLLKGFAHLGTVASVFDLAELGLALLVRSSARLDSPLPLADLAHPGFFPSLHGTAWAESFLLVSGAGALEFSLSVLGSTSPDPSLLPHGAS